MNTILEKLLTSKEPALRYKARAYLLDEDPDTPELRSLQHEIKDGERVRQLLSERDATVRFPFILMQSGMEPIGCWSCWQR